MTYTLKNDFGTAVCTDNGGQLISFVNDDTEYVWNGDAKYWADHAPHLFPVVCSPLNGHVTYDDTEYPMKKHGIVRDAAYRAVELGPDFVTLENKWSEKTFESFPYRYVFRVTHTLTETGFTTEYTVSAEEDMIFNVGGHPAFVCPHPGSGTFEDYQIRFHNAKGAVMSLTENVYMDPSIPKLKRIDKDGILPLKYSDFDRDAMIVEKLKVKKLDLVSAVNGHGIRFSFDGFDALGIWTPTGKEAPFVCLEPWCGLPASVDESGKAEDKKYAVSLKAGDVFRVSYGMSVI
ncbi:MAG: aldose 1-epimerase family protein [Clostridia bacterium]|nr:aldose 1-epimerase family protein [Clostridia bacterium]